MKTFFIIGVSGFLGKNLTIELLKQQDIQIIGFALPNEKNLELYEQHDNITLVRGNILNKDEVLRFLSTPADGDKYLIHAAGKISVYKKNDPLTTEINVVGTRNVIDACINKGFKKVVYVSSVDSVPKRKGNDVIYEPEEYDINKVDGVYSKSKVQANNIVLDAVKCSSLPACIVLPSAIMGPNDPFNAPINSAIKKFLNNKLPAITKGGYNIVDVRDVAKGILSALESGKPGESYFLTGRYVTVKELIEIAGKEANKKPIKNKVPHFIIKAASPFIEAHAKAHHKAPLFTGFSMDCLMQNSNYSCDKARKELGYEPRPLEETMKDTIEWMRNGGN